MATKKAQIDSILQPIGQLLSADFRHKVPPHQRNYSWSLEEVKQLWEDIMIAITEDYPEYFLGTIVVQEDRDEKTRSIIDGQQRLATLTMIFSGIRTIYAENSDERDTEVYNAYLGVRDRRTRVTEPRLSLNEVNESVFQKLIIEKAEDEDLDTAIKEKNQLPSNKLLIEATKYIRDAIRQQVKVATKYDSFLLELEEFLRDRVILILVSVGDEADAYLIFETLNDRGLELSINDLLKNYIFGRADKRLDAVRTQWQEMTVILGTQDQTQFLRHYWLSKYGIVRERDLYREMKRKFSSQSAVLRLMSELRGAADQYSAISNIDHQIWKSYGAKVRRNLEILQMFGLSQFRPLLLAAMDTLNPNEIEKVVELIVKISMRYSIIGSLGTGNIEKAYSDASIKCREGKLNTASKIFHQIKYIYPDDERFKNDFAEKEMTKAKIARYILSAIADKMEGSKTKVTIDDEQIVTLEHIMPKTISSEWNKAAKDEDEYMNYINRLGNLTLIEREKNRLAGSVSFDRKKKEAFSKSDILLTRQLTDYDQWTVVEIQERQQLLANHAVDLWKILY
jgi:hypothetical protein